MARTKAQNVAEPVAPDVTGGLLNGVTADEVTPPGDAKQQARRTALAAQKEKQRLAAEAAAAKAGNSSAAPKTDAPEAAPKTDEPKDEPKATEPAPLQKLTTEAKLRELLAVSEGRRDHAKVAAELRTGIEAILEDMARKPQATQPKSPKPTSEAGLAMEAAARTLLTRAGTATMGDFHKEVGAVSGDPKPRAAMDRLIKAGEVKREKVEGKVLYSLV